MKRESGRSSWPWPFVWAFLILAGWLVPVQTAFSQNAGVSFDFNTPDQYRNTPYNMTGEGWMNIRPSAAFPSAVFEVPQGGVGTAPGSGALDLLSGGNDQTSIWMPRTFDFSQAGQELTASIMVKIKAPTSNNRNTQLGFLTSTNSGVNANNGQGFMTVILQSTAQPALTYQLRAQRKPISGTTATEVTPSATTATLVAGNWYKLTVKFVNVKDVVADTYTIEASLEDMGADGQTSGGVVLSYGATDQAAADMVNATSLYLAVRGLENTGVDLWDNIHVQTASGAAAFVAQPEDAEVAQGQSAVFQALVDGNGPYTYQWYRSGVPIPGAGSWRYKTPPAQMDDNGTTYIVTVSAPDGDLISEGAGALLTVTPLELAVVSAGSVDGSVIGVRFNQPVAKEEAEDPANYSVNGMAPVSAVLRPSGDRVLLGLAEPISGAFTVEVDGSVMDLSGGTLGAADTAAGTTAGLTGLDVNNASPAGSNYSFGSGSFEITGGGADIWGAADQFRYVYTQKSGDFDVFTQIPNLDVVRGPTKAGFSVRASLDPASPQVLAAVNPRIPARNFFEGGTRPAYNAASVSWGTTTPASYPNAWLRFRRVANTFMRYSSTDGVNWVYDGQVSQPSIPETAFFGLAVCSVANGEPATGLFENYGAFAGYPGAVIAITAQPTDLTVQAGSAGALAITATVTESPATGVLAYVWQRSDGAGGWVNLPTAGSTSSGATTGTLYRPDNGAQYRCIVKAPGAADVTSAVITVTVQDTAAPTLVSASIPTQSAQQIVLGFSEPLSAVSGLNAANYVLTNTDTGAVVPVLGLSFLGTDAARVVLTTAQVLAEANYRITVSGVQDLNGNAIAAGAQREFSQSLTPPKQPVVIEFIGNITGSDQTALGNYVASAKFVARTPDFTFYNSTFGFNVSPGVTGLADSLLNNYGARVFTYFVPPADGVYKFWMRSDDSSRLLMNTSGVDTTDPLGAVEIGRLNASTANYTLVAQNITLTGGQKYYLEALMKEGTGGDGIAVTVRLQSDGATPPNTELMPASNLAFPSGAARPTPIVVEVYRGPTGSDIASLVAATNTAAFKNKVPSMVAYQPEFGTVRDMANTSIDNYLGRMFTYFVPWQTGPYKIWMRSDDASQIFMNTNAENSTDPAGVRYLGQLTAFTGNYTLVAQNIQLTAGQRYFVEALWKEGTGGDGMNVYITDQDDPNTPPNTVAGAGADYEFPMGAASVGAVSLAGVSPANPVVAAGQTVTLSPSGLKGALPITYSWLKNGEPVYGNVSSFTTLPLSGADDGAVFTLVVENAIGRAEQSVTVSVTADATAPSLVSAASVPDNRVVVRFNEPMDLETATSPGFYQISGGLAVMTAELDGITRSDVTLFTTAQAPGQEYTLTITGVQDASGNTISDVQVQFTGWDASSGSGLFVEVFLNISGTAVINLQQAESFVSNRPDATGYVPTFSWGTAPPANTGIAGNNFLLPTGGRDNFGARVSGYFRPPSDGLYRFYIRGDDGTQLSMNTNGAAIGGRVIIARNTGANSGTYANGNGLSGAGGSVSPVLDLKAGTLYYTEALLKEGGGGDYVSVAFRQVDPATMQDIGGLPPNSEAASGRFFAVAADPSQVTVTVTQTPPAELTVTENDIVTLSVAAEISPSSVGRAAGYLWRKFDETTGGYVDVPGGFTKDLTFTAKLSDAGNYRVYVLAPTAESAYDTVLTVVPDTKAPQIVSVNSLDGWYVGVLLNENVPYEVLNNAANWTVNGAAVYAAYLWSEDFTFPLGVAASGRHVVLELNAQIEGNFTVQSIGLSDLSSTPNAGSSSASGTVQGYVAQDIGSPVAWGYSQSNAPGEVDVLAGGNDIWGTSDVGHFDLTERTGDFDIHLRVQSLTRPTGAGGDIAKGGLMVRETLDANSRALHVLLNPPQSLNPSGRDQVEAGQRVGTGGGTAAWPGSTTFIPAGIPNAWVRVKRVGDTFTAYRSTDGREWIQIGTTLVTLPKTVYVGMATTAHTTTQSQDQFTIAQYRDIYIPNPPTITVQPSPAARSVSVGASVSYSVTASNPPASGDLVIQWRRDGIAIAGANSSTLTLASAETADAGIYTVDVGNDGGITSSEPVTLAVSNQLPVVNGETFATAKNSMLVTGIAALLANDSDPEGSALDIVAVSGMPPASVSINFDDGAIPAGAEAFGSTIAAAMGGVDDSGVLSITPASGNQSGAIVLEELTPGKRVSAITASFKLRIAEGSAEPADGFSFNFANDLPLAATGPRAAENGMGSGFSFCIDSYRFAPYPGGGTANTSGMKLRYGGVDVAGVQTAAWNIGRYVAVSISVTAEGLATVTVDGTNAFTNVPLPSYAPAAGRVGIYARTGGQFQAHSMDELEITLLTLDTALGGQVVLDGGNVTYTPPADVTGQDKYYYLVSDGQEGGITVGEVTVNISGTANPPVITLQPAGQTVVEGDDVTLTVTATGALAYQWLKGEAEIGGQTAASLVLTDVNASSAGSYRVRVSNADGSVLSDPAVIRVLVPVTFEGVRIQEGQIVATIQTIAGLMYDIETAGELKSGGLTVWQPLATVQGTGAAIPLNAPIGAGNQFFRISIR